MPNLSPPLNRTVASYHDMTDSTSINSRPLLPIELSLYELLPPPLIRLPTRLDTLSDGLKLDVRAHQRTYEGAYTRTAIGALLFAIVIIKLFLKEFLPIGAVYTAYALFLYFAGLHKSRQVDFYYNPDKDKEYFVTLGWLVMLLAALSVAAYLALFVLVLTM